MPVSCFGGFLMGCGGCLLGAALPRPLRLNLLKSKSRRSAAVRVPATPIVQRHATAPPNTAATNSNSWNSLPLPDHHQSPRQHPGSSSPRSTPRLTRRQHQEAMIRLHVSIVAELHRVGRAIEDLREDSLTHRGGDLHLESAQDRRGREANSGIRLPPPRRRNLVVTMQPGSAVGTVGQLRGRTTQIIPFGASPRRSLPGQPPPSTTNPESDSPTIEVFSGRSHKLQPTNIDPPRGSANPARFPDFDMV